MRARWAIIAIVFATVSCRSNDRPAAVASAHGDRLVRAARAVPGQYVVVLKADAAGVAPSVAAGGARLKALAHDLAARHGGTVLRIYERALHGFSVRLTPDAARALSAEPAVAWVEEDAAVRAAALTTQYFAPWNLDRLDQRSATLDGLYAYYSGATAGAAGGGGDGVHAYVLDTGIRTSHVEFATGRASSDYDAINDGSTGDCNGHGTHVAATLGGRTYGVAKRVALHSVRVLDCSATGTLSGVIAGLDWVTANHQTPAVANLSLVAEASAALDAAVASAVDAGVTVVTAAGDGGRDACGISPAREPKALTVAASDRADAPAAFTNQGGCVDLFAPGVSILSAWSGSNWDTNTLSGTSMAAPHVTGAAALYLGRYPTKSPVEVARALFANSTHAPAAPRAGTPDRLLYTRFVDDDTSGDTAAPTVSIDAPADGSTATGTVAVSASASDDVGVTRVELYAGGRYRGSAVGASPYAFSWNSAAELNGPLALTARAYDASGRMTESAAVTVTVSNPGVAHFDADLGAPRCETVATHCDAGALLDGRADLGPEQNAPNALRDTAGELCPDGKAGAYHVEESVDRVAVATLDGTDLAGGKDVRIDVDVWAAAPSQDVLDLYVADDATAPAWRWLGSLAPAGTGRQTLSIPYTLGAGPLQAVRSAFRYGGKAAICTQGSYDDRDDLVFAVGAGSADTTPPAVAIASPAPGAVVSGTVTYQADVTDDHLVSRVELYVGTDVVATLTAPPFAIAWNSGTVPNGDVVLTAKAYDGAGNVATATVPITVLDVTPPTVAITSPLDGGSVDGTFPVDVTASDDGLVKRVELYVGTTLLATDTIAPYHFTWTAPNGVYTLTAKAYDGAGNTATSAPVTVTVGDVTNPTCAITAPVDGAAVQGMVTIDADAKDNVGLAKVEFYLSDGTTETLLDSLTTPRWSTHWDSAVAPNGTYAIRCVAYDLSGNSGASTPVSVTHGDANPPTVAIQAPADGDTVSGAVLIDVAAADDQAVKQVQILLDGAPLATLTAPPYQLAWSSGTVPNGTHTLAATATDYAGNTATTDPVVTITTSDLTPPSTSIVLPASGLTVAGTVAVTAVAADPDGRVVKVELYADGTLAGTASAPPFAFDLDSTTLANGSRTLTTRAYDVSGNFADSLPVAIDVENPGAVHDPALGVPLCATPLARCHTGLLVDGRGPVGPEANAPNTLGGTQACPDGALGSYHADESIDFISISSLDGSPLAAGKPAQVDVRLWAYSATDDHLDLYVAADASAPSWVYATTLQPGAAGSQTLSGTVTLPGVQGVQAIRAALRYGGSPSPCTDGDYDDRDDVAFAIAPPPDVTPPTIAITAPADGATLSATHVTLEASASDDVGVVKVEFAAGAALLGAVTAPPYRVDWDTSGLTAGSYVLTARAYDLAGNVGTSKAVTVIVPDRTAPAVSLSAPLDRETVLGTVQLSADATDDVGVAKVDFFLGTKLLGTATRAPWAITWNTTGTTDGAYTITAKASDAAGNVAQAGAAVIVSNSGNASWDRTLKAPKCGAAAWKCASGSLLVGRATLGPEPKQPNTLGGSCADGAAGVFHVDESADAITVSTTDQSTLAAGKTVRIDVKVWATQSYWTDALDVFAAPDAKSPYWTLVATLAPTRPRAQVLSTSWTLPAAGLPAVRAQFRHGGSSASPCSGGSFDDHDDLALTVTP